MKYQFQISTGQFEFIMGEIESNNPQLAVESFNALKATYKASQNAPEGLTAKVFDACLDKYLSGGGMDSDTYAAMSKAQVDLVQTLKRSLARIKRRTQPEESTEIN